MSDHEIESRLRDEGKQPFFRDEDAVLYVRRGNCAGRVPVIALDGWAAILDDLPFDPVRHLMERPVLFLGSLPILVFYSGKSVECRPKVETARILNRFNLLGSHAPLFPENI